MQFKYKPIAALRSLNTQTLCSLSTGPVQPKQTLCSLNTGPVQLKYRFHATIQALCSLNTGPVQPKYSPSHKGVQRARAANKYRPRAA